MRSGIQKVYAPYHGLMARSSEPFTGIVLYINEPTWLEIHTFQHGCIITGFAVAINKRGEAIKLPFSDAFTLTNTNPQSAIIQIDLSPEIISVSQIVCYLKLIDKSEVKFVIPIEKLINSQGSV